MSNNLLECLLLFFLAVVVPSQNTSENCNVMYSYYNITDMCQCRDHKVLYVFQSKVCDGKLDCPNGTEEKNCPQAIGKKLRIALITYSTNYLHTYN